MSEFVCKEVLLSNLLNEVSQVSGVPAEDLDMNIDLVDDLELSADDILAISSGLSDCYDAPLDIDGCSTIDEAYAHLRTQLSC